MSTANRRLSCYSMAHTGHGQSALCEYQSTALMCASSRSCAPVSQPGLITACSHAYADAHQPQAGCAGVCGLLPRPPRAIGLTDRHCALAVAGNPPPCPPRPHCRAGSAIHQEPDPGSSRRFRPTRVRSEAVAQAPAVITSPRPGGKSGRIQGRPGYFLFVRRCRLR